MNELRALQEIEGIRVRRVEDAEEALRRAQQRLRAAEQALKDAQAALADFQQRLPDLIEQLYADCLFHLVSREFMQDKIFEESRLRAKVEDFKAQVTECQKTLEAAQTQLHSAQTRLNLERVKLDALRELIKSERRLIQIASARLDAKVLDDLAGSKFVRAMRQSA